MRIPTGFDQNSRFPHPSSSQTRRNDGGHTRERGALRRLFRLVIALVLVIVVMDAAGDPAIYRPFFGDQQGTVATPSTLLPEASGDPELTPVAEKASRGQDSNDASAKGHESLFPDAELVDFARQLVPLLSEQERMTLTHLLAWQRGGNKTALEPLDLSTERGETVIDSVEQAAESLQSGVSDDADLAGISQRYAKSLQAILSAARTASDDGPEGDAPEGPPLQLPRQQLLALNALQSALDESYQQKVIDGAVWSADDADAFYRYLERAASSDFLPRRADVNAPAGHRPIRVGVVPLIQQPATYQGRMVWINGTVARASRIEAKENPFGVEDYWELWIRPADGTDRPVVLYVPDVSERVAAVGPQAALNRGPEVSAVGVFLKRRLFHSVGGVEQAPVIVGRAIAPSVVPAERSFTASGSARPPFWSLVAIAAVVGVVLAGWLMWQATVSAKRSRQLRHKAERGSPLLPETSEIVAKETAPPTHIDEDRR